MKNVSFIEDVALVTLKGCPADIDFFARVLRMISAAGVNVDMISQTPPSGGHVDMCFTVSDSDVPSLLTVTSALSSQFPSVKTSINGNNCKVAVFDESMANEPGYAAGIFEKAAAAGAEIRLITTSENDISMLIVNDGLYPLLEALKG